MLQFVLVCCAMAPPPPLGFVDDGPSMGWKLSQSSTLIHGLVGDLLLRAVRSGMKPEQVRRIFGAPLLATGSGGGREDWWYLEYGVVVSFPARMLSPDPRGDINRIKGGVGP